MKIDYKSKTHQQPPRKIDYKSTEHQYQHPHSEASADTNNILTKVDNVKAPYINTPEKSNHNIITGEDHIDH